MDRAQPGSYVETRRGRRAESQRAACGTPTWPSPPLEFIGLKLLAILPYCTFRFGWHCSTRYTNAILSFSRIESSGLCCVFSISRHKVSYSCHYISDPNKPTRKRERLHPTTFPRFARFLRATRVDERFRSYIRNSPCPRLCPHCRTGIGLSACEAQESKE